MGRMISKKLRSSKGASLTFALLAFLVCAVISAVLLASASSATGRLSGLAESDQRYYAVTSAAQLFCDTLEGQQFSIQRTHTNYAVNARAYYEVDGITYGRTAIDDEIETWFGADIKNKKNNPNVFSFNATGLASAITDEGLSADETDTAPRINNIRSTSLLADAALSYVIGIPATNESGAPVLCSVSQAFVKTPGSLDTNEVEYGTYHLEYTTGDDTVTGPAITVVAKLRKDGSIVLEFSNGASTDPEDSPKYKVTVTLTAEVQDDSALPHTTTSDSYAFRFDPGIETGTPCSYECTVTTTVKTKTTTIKWNVTDIKKGAA